MDLHYPPRLHVRHDGYPLGPESLVIDHSMYSSTQQVFPEALRKFTPNLRDKVKYVLHYRNVKLYLQLGLVINKVRRVLTFQHSTTFISWSFLRDFGKTQENLKNRVSVELITGSRILRNRVAKPTCYIASNPMSDIFDLSHCSYCSHS